MNQITKTLLHAIFIIVIVGVSLFIYHQLFAPKFAYVRTGEILNKYKGMTISNQQFEKEMAIVRGNIDTLKNRYETLRAERPQAGVSEKEWGYRIATAESEYMQYQNSATQKMELRRQELLKQVLDKINATIETYSKEKGYDLILGATDNGSILSGKDNYDITSEILSRLNQESGKPLAKENSGADNK